MFKWFALCVLAASPAFGGCGTYDSWADQLTGEYEEQVLGAGLSESGEEIIQLWLNTETGTFTITSFKQGRICTIVSGTRWEVIKPGEDT